MTNTIKLRLRTNEVPEGSVVENRRNTFDSDDV